MGENERRRIGQVFLSNDSEVVSVQVVEGEQSVLVCWHCWKINFQAVLADVVQCRRVDSVRVRFHSRASLRGSQSEHMTKTIDAYLGSQ